MGQEQIRRIFRRDSNKLSRNEITPSLELDSMFWLEKWTALFGEWIFVFGI